VREAVRLARRRGDGSSMRSRCHGVGCMLRPTDCMLSAGCMRSASLSRVHVMATVMAAAAATTMAAETTASAAALEAATAAAAAIQL